MILLDNIRYTLRGSGIIRGFEKARNQKVSKIANALHKDFRDVYEFTRSSGDDRLTFMRKLSKKYNWDSMEYKTAKPEDRDIIYKLFKTVKNPNENHNKIIQYFRGSMQSLANLFELTQNKKDKVEFVSRMYKEIFKEHPDIYEELVPELLQSSQIDEIMKNFDKYKPFFKLNKGNCLASHMLENLIANGTYSKEKYERIIKEQCISRKFPNIKSLTFNPKVFAERYTEERGKLLKGLMKYSFINRYELAEDEAAELLKIYSSTTHKNYRFRKKIIRAYREVKEDSTERNPHILRDLNKLFDTIEKDKNARNFVQKEMEYNVGVNSVAEFNEIFEQIPSKILEEFSEEARFFIRKSNYKKGYVLMLKEEVERLIQARNAQRHKGLHGIITSIGDFSQRLIGKLKPAQENPVNVEVVEKIIQKPVSVVEEAPKATSAEDLLKYIPPEYRTVAIEKPVKAPTAHALRKLQVEEKVRDFVSKKLGSRTLADQGIDYKKYATRMRFEMLPEIFASIAETRKADRMLGKKKSLSSNADAIELFKLINGKNKKLVNYLLKKRRDDGTRMFEVKSIIDMLKDVESTIKENKLIDSSYSPKQAKSHYSYMYDMTVLTLGKVKKQPAKPNRKV